MAKLLAEYFSDPICPWVWGNEPKVRKLRLTFGSQIDWVHRMIGLPDRGMGDITPEEVASHWEKISLESGMPIDYRAWSGGFPSSSRPASLAVKAAGRQGKVEQDRLLRLVREALFVRHCRVDDPRILLDLAAEVADLDVARLAADMDGPEIEKALAVDMEAARHPLDGSRDLKPDGDGQRYAAPTLILHNQQGECRVLDWDHSYNDHLAAIGGLAADIQTAATSPTIEALLRDHGSATTEEVSLICEIPWDSADEAINRLAEQGLVTCQAAGHFCLWHWCGP